MIPHTGEYIGHKALLILEKNGIVEQCGNNGRNRIFKHTDLNHLLTDTK